MNSSLAFPSNFIPKKTEKCSAKVDVTPSPYGTDSIMWFGMFTISTATKMSKHGNFHGLISGKLLGYSVMLTRSIQFTSSFSR